VRCTAPDRLPIVGPVDATDLPGLWVNTAMGARGLTLALLCGELLAARLQGEPLPLDAKLARALGTERL
jgi:tRNA 5-methylaminomethyl-2-thiouridine biosynthesis bifunctional protein